MQKGISKEFDTCRVLLQHRCGSIVPKNPQQDSKEIAVVRSRNPIVVAESYFKSVHVHIAGGDMPSH